MNDTRLGVSIALTAAAQGAVVLNHVSAVSLLKDGTGKITGAVVRNNETGKEIQVKAKVIVNATGPFTGTPFLRAAEALLDRVFGLTLVFFLDQILTMDDPLHKPSVTPSSGVHVRGTFAIHCKLSKKNHISLCCLRILLRPIWVSSFRERRTVEYYSCCLGRAPLSLAPLISPQRYMCNIPTNETIVLMRSML